MNDEELSERERSLFRKINRDFDDRGLENKVVERLASEHLIRRKKPFAVLRWAAILLMCLSTFFAGRYYPGETNNFQYVLLLYRNDSTPSNRFKEYEAWASKIRETGVSITGEKLADDVAWVSPTDHTGTQAVLSGFFMISAASEQEALAIAKASPHAKYNGTIEIRKIVNQ